MPLRSPVGERMDWQANNEAGVPQVQEGDLALDPNDPRGASGSASGGPNSIENIRGSTFRNFTPPLQQQEIATKFMQQRGIPLNSQNRQQVMQFLMGADAAAQPEAAPPDTMGDISAGIDAADAGAGVPGPAPAAPLDHPVSETPQQGGEGWNPLWLLVPAVGKRIIDDPKAVPPEGTKFLANETVVPLMIENQPLPPDTEVRMYGDGFQANVDGQWITVDEPDDAVVQKAISDTYGNPDIANELPPDVAITPPPEAAAPAPVADPATMPIDTDEVIPPSARMPQEPSVDAPPSVEVGSNARVEASKARTSERRKGKPKETASGNILKTIRGR